MQLRRKRSIFSQMNAQEKPLRRSVRDQIDLIAALIVRATQEARCAGCGQTATALDMSYDAESGTRTCDNCWQTGRTPFA
jgi:hypothetical protein